MMRRLLLWWPATLSLACSPLTPTSSDPADTSVGGHARAEAPEGAKLRTILAADRRQFEVSAPGLLTAHVPGVLRAELRAEGLRVRHGEDELGLATVALGSQSLGGVEPVLGGCAPSSEWVGGRCAAAAELPHGPLTEWWTSGADGVRQGWTLHEPQGDLVELRLAVTAGELGGVDTDGLGAWFTGTTGKLWRYDDLLAWDAAGTLLSAELRPGSGGLLVRVATSGALWPVTVDPVLSSEDKLVASDWAKYDYFGRSVAGAGDIDGDGYADVLVGVPFDDDNGTSSGSVYVYYGSSSGIDSASEDKLVASDGAADDYFGWSVTGAGDVDGDGYADVLVGAYKDEDNGSDSGSAYVYYGSSTGIDGASEDKLVASEGASDDL